MDKFFCEQCGKCIPSTSQVDVDMHYTRYHVNKKEEVGNNKIHKTVNMTQKSKPKSEDVVIQSYTCTMCEYTNDFLADVVVHTAQAHCNEIKEFETFKPSPSEVLISLMIKQNNEIQEDFKKFSEQIKGTIEGKESKIEDILKSVNSAFENIQSKYNSIETIFGSFGLLDHQKASKYGHI